MVKWGKTCGAGRLGNEWKLLGRFAVLCPLGQLGHRNDDVAAVLAFEGIQQRKLARLNRGRGSFIDRRCEVELRDFALDGLHHVGEGVTRITVTRPLHQVIDEGGDAFGTVEPGFGEAVPIIMRIMRCIAYCSLCGVRNYAEY